MKIAIISDIHSNHYALSVLLKELETHRPDKLICAGDMFGYYPWAVETYNLLKGITLPTVYIKGNHDEMILDKLNDSTYHVEVSYWEAVEQNLQAFQSSASDALAWLKTLQGHTTFTEGAYKFNIYHGTPADTLNGRYYPDDNNLHAWFPNKNEILILGHTHYPLHKVLPTGGVIINPGSVGQPRDGNTMPAWGMFNTETGEYTPHRFSYPVDAAVAELEAINWDRRAIEALKKDKPGKLVL